MFDRPWVRLVLGAVAAALLGAMAARVAVSAAGGAGDGGAIAAKAGAGGSGSGGGSSFGGGSGSSGGGSGGGGSGGGSGGAGAGAAGGATATLAAGSGRATVHVTGEVRRPGVYLLKEGSRVDDAVRRAGGPTRDGDRQALNLAAPVRDGQQVRVPPTAAATRAAAGASTGAAAGGAGVGAAGGDAAGGAAGPATPVDLNTATLEELQTLDGVGPTTAEKIIKLREERGGLAGVDDLDEVPGIGAKKLEALRAQLEP